jgi:hypothetical protein
MRETVGEKSIKTSCKKSAKSFLAKKSAKSTGLSLEAVGLVSVNADFALNSVLGWILDHNIVY